MGSSATISYSHALNECTRRPQECVYATCDTSQDEVGPVWGHGPQSVRRVLAQLTEECSCGADWHEE